MLQLPDTDFRIVVGHRILRFISKGSKADDFIFEIHEFR
jgi:hypothetical protein